MSDAEPDPKLVQEFVDEMSSYARKLARAAHIGGKSRETLEYI